MWGTSMSLLRPLKVSGPSSNRVDIIFMGDGYTSEEIPTQYNDQISNFLDYMFNGGLVTDPMGRYKSFFNVYAIDVVSKESGADHPEWGLYRDTALGATYRYDGVTDRLLYVNES